MAELPNHGKSEKGTFKKQPIPKWYLWEASLLFVTLVAFLVLIVLLIFG